jgi:hypothetical protein
MYLGLRAKEGKRFGFISLKKNMPNKLEDRNALASGAQFQINISGYPDMKFRQFQKQLFCVTDRADCSSRKIEQS